MRCIYIIYKLEEKLAFAMGARLVGAFRPRNPARKTSAGSDGRKRTGEGAAGGAPCGGRGGDRAGAPLRPPRRLRPPRTPPPPRCHIRGPRAVSITTQHVVIL